MERQLDREFIGIREDELRQNHGGFNHVRSNMQISTTNEPRVD